MRPRTDHFDGRRFFNPNGAKVPPVRMMPRMLRARWTRWPASIPVSPRQPPPSPGPGDVAVTFIGHATFLIQAGATNILIDPVYAGRASPLPFAGPRRVRAPGVRFDDLPAISIVLLSHNHYDHCDRKALVAIEQRWHPVVVTPIGNGHLLRSAGIARVVELDWWETATGLPLPISLPPAQHFSARGMFDRNRALWGGFFIAADRHRILFAGDTGFGPHFL